MTSDFIYINNNKMKNPRTKTRNKRKTAHTSEKERTNAREIPLKLYAPAYFDDLEQDAHIKKYIVIKQTSYLDNIYYTIKAKVI